MADGAPRTTARRRISAPWRDHRNTLLTAALVCLALFSPGDTMPPLDGGLPWIVTLLADKVVHAVLFFVQTAMLARSMRHGRCRWPRATTAGMVLMFAAATELVQGVVPGRQASVADLAADTVGLALALVLVWPDDPGQADIEGGDPRHPLSEPPVGAPRLAESAGPREIAKS